MYMYIYICILSVFLITVVYFIVKKTDIHVCISVVKTYPSIDPIAAPPDIINIYVSL